jgi:thiamine phosphate synthase YjbQ (UPF0047 family)
MKVFIWVLLSCLLEGLVVSFSGSQTASRSFVRRSFLKAAFSTHFEELSIQTGRSITLKDITQEVAEVVKKTGIKEGVVTVLSKHSTVGITIQEFEPRFVDDARQFLLKLAPPYYPWLHNDIDYRVGPPDWPGGDEAWRNFRAGEPPNAHSHLIAMTVGTTESIPIHNSLMAIGKYQNVIVVRAIDAAAAAVS